MRGGGMVWMLKGGLCWQWGVMVALLLVVVVAFKVFTLVVVAVADKSQHQPKLSQAAQLLRLL